MVQLFATPGLRALTQVLIRSPEQVAWLLKFQQKQFHDALPEGQTMEALDVPVKLIWGQADPHLSTAVAEEFRSRLKHASLDLISAGHWLQIDEPEQVARVMLY